MSRCDCCCAAASAPGTQWWWQAACGKQSKAGRLAGCFTIVTSDRQFLRSVKILFLGEKHFFVCPTIGMGEEERAWERERFSHDEFGLKLSARATNILQSRQTGRWRAHTRHHYDDDDDDGVDDWKKFSDEKESESERERKKLSKSFYSVSKRKNSFRAESSRLFLRQSRCCCWLLPVNPRGEDVSEMPFRMATTNDERLDDSVAGFLDKVESLACQIISHFTISWVVL